MGSQVRHQGTRHLVQACKPGAAAKRLEPLLGLHARPALTCLKLLHCVHQQLPCCLGMLHISLCSLDFLYASP